MENVKLKWTTEKRKISELVPYEFNPRILTDENAEKLKKSLEKFDLVEIPVINTDNVLIAGHQRIKMLFMLGRGQEEIDVRVPNRTLTVTELKEYNVTSNVSIGIWDIEVLESAFSDIDIADIGVDIESLKLGDDIKYETDEALKAEEDDYKIPEVIKTEIVQGDLIEIGEHRLLCGDSTDSDSVAKLMDGEKADMVFTDPPYGIDYGGGRSTTSTREANTKILNDDLSGQELGELISNVFLFNKEEADVYVCVSPKVQKPFLDFIEDSGREIDAVIVWDKKQPGLGYMSYRRQCEFILFVKGGKFKKGDNSDFDLWSISRDNGTDYKHGTQKPIAVPSRGIKNSSKKDDLCLDYFLGSGSTMVAAHQLERKCYGMELDPKYCQVICERMIKLDNTLKITINGIDCTEKIQKQANA